MKRSKKPSVIVENPDLTLKKIGAKLRRLRKDLGYENSDDFAYDNHLNRSQYGKYEAGRQDMRITSLLRVVNALGLTLEEFFSDGMDQRENGQ